MMDGAGERMPGRGQSEDRERVSMEDGMRRQTRTANARQGRWKG